MTEPSSIGLSTSAWNKLYRLGAFCGLLFIAGTLLDIFIGTSSGANLLSLPQTAAERFAEFNTNWRLGLYHLDFLNLLNALMMIPVFVALFAALRKTAGATALVALVCFIIGTALFIANNSALALFELSKKYAGADPGQQTLLAAAGEAWLVKGTHGSYTAFLGFGLILIGDFLIATAMLNGKIFSRITAWLGITGNLLLFIYLALVTFLPDVKSSAMLFSAPGGLLSTAWLILLTTRLLQLNEE